MQRLLLFLSSLLLTASSISAATLSGTVTSVATCAPVSGQKVYATDSLQSWKDSAVTNSAGHYSMTIPSTVYAGSAGQIFVTTPACGTTVYTSVSYRSGNNVHANLVVCGTIPGAVNGWVMLGANVGDPKAAKVWLIRLDIDPSTLDTTLTAVDSAFVTSGPSIWERGTFQFTMACPVASDRYLLKAALLLSDPAYASYLPSYFDSGLTWNSRAPLMGASFNTYGNYYINLKPGSNPGGPGFIGGSVLVGANKSTAVGDPLSSRVLILTTAAGKAIGYTHSDASGKFQFPNLAYGTYKIFGDAGGKKNPALTITLSATQKTVGNIVFEENNKKFEGHINNVGIGRVNNLPGVSVFPNPVTDFVGVQGLSSIGGDKTIVLSSMTGAEISRQTVSNEARISTATLPAGIYLLQVQTEAGSASFRIVK